MTDPVKFALSGRGQLVMAKALAYAIHAIDNLPKEKQEWSDRQDMAYILHNVYSSYLQFARQAVEFHTGQELDIEDHKIEV